MGLSTWKIATRQALLTPLLVGGACGVLALVASQVALPWVAALTVMIGGIGAMMMLWEVRRPLLAALALSLPLHLDVNLLWQTGHQGGPTGFRLSLTDFILIVLLLLWLAEFGSGRATRLKSFWRVSIPLLLFVGAGLISTLVAEKPLFSGFELLDMAKGFLLYLYLANCVRDRRDVNWILAGLMAALLFESSLGLYQWLLQRPLGLSFLGEVTAPAGLGAADWTGVRARGTLYSANIFSMYLGMTLPIVAAVLLGPARHITKLLAGVVTVFGLVATVLTLSRGGWMGMLAAVVVLVVLSGRKSSTTRGRRLILSVLIALLVTLFIGLLTNGAVIRRLTENDRGAAEARVPLMNGALAIIADHPVTGTGLNNYLFGLRPYDPTRGLARYGGLGVVHNSFLLIAAETGLFGLAAFVWLLLALGWRGLASLRVETVSFAAVLTVGLLACEADMIVQSMVDYAIFGDPQLFSLFWFLAGLLVAIAGSSTGLTGKYSTVEEKWVSRSLPS
jgi:putative inorganic carbon (hco3(-)) transporter